MERYSCNRNSLTEQDQEKLAGSRVLIVGCGGLGGYVTELLARVGAGRLTVADGDVFTETNLNRQLFCTMETMGKYKAVAASERVSAVNPLVTCEAICEFLTEENADRLLAGHDIAVDALDNADSRALLLEAAARAGIPLVHGAIAGFQGRVSVIYPGDATSTLLSKVKTAALSRRPATFALPRPASRRYRPRRLSSACSLKAGSVKTGRSKWTCSAVYLRLYLFHEPHK